MQTPPSRDRPRARAACAITERGVFTAATAVAIVHALDDAFLGRQPGAGPRPARARGADRGRRRRARRSGPSPACAPTLRAATAFTFGGLAAVNGAMHVQHIRVDGVAHSDVTGVLAFAAGLVLAGLAVAILWRHRRPGSWRVWLAARRSRRRAADRRPLRARPDRAGDHRGAQVARADRRGARHRLPRRRVPLRATACG